MKALQSRASKCRLCCLQAKQGGTTPEQEPNRLNAFFAEVSYFFRTASILPHTGVTTANELAMGVACRSAGGRSGWRIRGGNAGKINRVASNEP
jgi:hypothetical protein